MGLLKRFVRNDLAELHGRGVRVRVIGDRTGLDAEILSLLAEAENLTRANEKFTLVVAFNYGGRQEIVRAAARIAEEARAGRIDPADVDMTMFERYPTRRAARSGSGDPHQRRAQNLEFPALAIGLCGVRFSSDPLAGFRSRRAGERDRRVSPPRTPLRRT
jgi:hypothetical protein